MARSKQDIYKRRCAQAINHLAGAILDLNDVYTVFLEQHPEMAEELKAAMMASSIARDDIIAFTERAWELNEDSIKVYAG